MSLIGVWPQIKKKYLETAECLSQHRTWTAILVGCLMPLLLSVSSAQAAQLNARYTLSLGILSVGRANLTANITHARYHVEATLSFIGLADIIANVKGAAAANGTHDHAAIHPANFIAKASAGKDERLIRMRMAKGTVSSVDIAPPLVLLPGNMPVEAHQKKNIMDPLSALIMPVASGRGMLDAENCNRVLPVFDGGARISIRLTYKETKTIKTKAYSGPVLVCTAQYTPISGYQPSQKAANYMQKNKKMSVWLAPVTGTRFLAPVRANIETPMGAVVFEAARWEVSTSLAEVTLN